MGYGLYRIGQVSKIFGLPVKTLRFYDEIGLFVPAYISEDTKYRYYNWQQFERLRLIIYLRSLGFSLKEIGSQLDTGNGEHYIETIRKHCDMMNQRIQEWTALKSFMENRLSEIESARKAPHNRVFFEQFPEQRVCLFKRVIEGYEEHERAVLDFQSEYHLHPGISRFGQVFSFEKIIQQKAGVCDGIFITEEALTYKFFNAFQEELHCFPAGLYAVLYYSKPTKESYPFWIELLNEIEKQSYEPSGYIIRIIIYERWENTEREDYLSCMRVLVRKKGLADEATAG